MKKEDQTEEHTGAKAWLLKAGRGINVALGQYEVIHILDTPRLISIPQAPAYCSKVVLWNNRIIPIIDLTAWFFGHNDTETVNTAIVAIVVYLGPEGEYCYGGLRLRSIPLLNQVNDQQFCDLPEGSAEWKRISLSCFTDSAVGFVPVLDLNRVFSRTIS